MGFYSYTCAASGLPIRSAYSSFSPITHDVVVLDSKGVLAFGEYDGYGGVGSWRASEFNHPFKIVLRAFYKSSKWDSYGESHSDPWQGFFGSSAFVDAIYEAKLSLGDEFDAHQYRTRVLEYSRFMRNFDKYISSAAGIDYSDYYRLMYYLEDDSEDSNLFESAFNDIKSKLLNKNIISDGRTFTKLLILQEKELERAVIDEIISAWKLNKPAQDLDLGEIFKLENMLKSERHT